MRASKTEAGSPAFVPSVANTNIERMAAGSFNGVANRKVAVNEYVLLDGASHV